jgi:hypothetical protein
MLVKIPVIASATDLPGCTKHFNRYGQAFKLHDGFDLSIDAVSPPPLLG